VFDKKGKTMTEQETANQPKKRRSRVPVRFLEDTLALKCQSGYVLLASSISGLILTALFVLFLALFFHGVGHRYFLLLLISGTFGGFIGGVLDREERKLQKTRDVSLPLTYITLLILLFSLEMLIIFEPLKRVFENSGSEFLTLQVNSSVIAFGLFILTTLLISPIVRIWKTLYFSLLEFIGGVDPSLYFDLNLIETEFQRSVANYTRYGHIFCLVLFDIHDHAELEEVHGKRIIQRIIGDLVTKINKTIRSSDRVGRAENGAFIALLTNTNVEQALIAAKRLSDVIEKNVYKVGKTKLPVKLICGIAEVSNEKDSLGKLIKAATEKLDQMMLKPAKEL
jgi:diguanylate cyclase (GGDEF)-like protein